MTISEITVRDIRFPTSREQDGSDALNLGDYSATYVVLGTGSGLEGHGLTFTNGRGNEIVVAAVHALKHHVLGRSLDDTLHSPVLRDLHRRAVGVCHRPGAPEDSQTTRAVRVQWPPSLLEQVGRSRHVYDRAHRLGVLSAGICVLKSNTQLY